MATSYAMLNLDIIKKINTLGNNSDQDKRLIFQTLCEIKGSAYTVCFHNSDTNPDAIDKALDKLFGYVFGELKSQGDNQADML